MTSRSALRVGYEGGLMAATPSNRCGAVNDGDHPYAFADGALPAVAAGARLGPYARGSVMDFPDVRGSYFGRDALIAEALTGELPKPFPHTSPDCGLHQQHSPCVSLCLQKRGGRHTVPARLLSVGSWSGSLFVLDAFPSEIYRSAWRRLGTSAQPHTSCTSITYFR